MAAIDKTYGNWEQYLQLRDWCIGKYFRQGQAIISPSIFLMDYNYAKDFEGSNKEFVFWNTPTYFDIWLIRNCPLDFIQARLREQYGSEYLEIKEYRSIYDTYERNGLGKNVKVRILTKPHVNYRNGWWMIQLVDRENEGCWAYDSINNTWVDMYRSDKYYDRYEAIYKELSFRKLIRLIKKWNLPAGIEVQAYGPLRNQVYRVLTHE
jgi:hypothetical protein